MGRRRNAITHSAGEKPKRGQGEGGSIELAVFGKPGIVADRLKAAARAAAFAQFTVDAYACSDEQRNGCRESGQQDDNTEALPGTFAELVGNEEACSRADGHFGDGSQ